MKTYIQIGAGGTGSQLYRPLLTYLTHYHANRNETFQLLVIDGDTIEVHNLERQLFNSEHVGENKATALVNQHPSPNVTAFPRHLGPDNMNIIREGSTVLITVDNFPIRAAIERHAMGLNDVSIINAGNEKNTGSCQIFLRRDDKNWTPPLSFEHPEILAPGKTRAEMSCQEEAELEGGEQTIIANLMSASVMLSALTLIHENTEDTFPWHEVHFDTTTGKMRPTDLRAFDGWNAYQPPPTPTLNRDETLVAI